MRKLAAKTGQRPKCWSKRRSAREGPSRSYCPQRDRTEDRRAVWLVGDDRRNLCHRCPHTQPREAPSLTGHWPGNAPRALECRSRVPSSALRVPSEPLSEGGASPGRARPRGPGDRGSRTSRAALSGVGAGCSRVFERRTHGGGRHSPPPETQDALKPAPSPPSPSPLALARPTRGDGDGPPEAGGSSWSGAGPSSGAWARAWREGESRGAGESWRGVWRAAPQVPAAGAQERQGAPKTGKGRDAGDFTASEDAGLRGCGAAGMRGCVS